MALRIEVMPRTIESEEAGHRAFSHLAAGAALAGPTA
jgi:hypothetical protein